MARSRKSRTKLSLRDQRNPVGTIQHGFVTPRVAQQTNESPFMCLPAEIRLKIYPKVVNSFITAWPPSMLLVCRQTYNETIDLYREVMRKKRFEFIVRNTDLTNLTRFVRWLCNSSIQKEANDIMLYYEGSFCQVTVSRWFYAMKTDFRRAAELCKKHKKGLPPRDVAWWKYGGIIDWAVELVFEDTCFHYFGPGQWGTWTPLLSPPAEPDGWCYWPGWMFDRPTRDLTKEQLALLGW